MNGFNMQPILQNEKVVMYPLRENDFDDLYSVASDPKVWEQHPNRDRWKKEVFTVFFEGALKSKGAFKVVDKESGKVIGSTRIYDYNDAEDCIFIGYTFYGVSSWGKGFNLAAKKTMLDYLFRFVSKVKFHVGSDNIRSQIAIERLGANKIAELEVAYFGDPVPRLNFEYEISKEQCKKTEQ
ncbi:GNAT family N-acetyltransferase [Sphingobacterium daejeonense]|uniref:GNAT family N-acetyltransferase n=1 Tax=Sphingobacterium daejeonense TaxID=371142 RepID=UPI0010C4D1B9|nr:GNAT family N-acetyltransferase [Sphingobacterium daejeonense]VTP91629.1 Uncharacterised protein [Sphingobacterium daejeonense]